jgi:hypothetical protein
MVKNPAIVIVTFNRPKSLERLLMNIAQAHYEDAPVDLVISIDFQDSDSHSAVVKLAREFEWNKGSKQIIEHKANLGLRAHVLSCGDLTSKYGSIIMLEDDLYVSPFFYRFACQSASFYGNDENIAGISLYNHKTNIHNSFPFDLIGEDGDTYFLQIASSWGQLWTNSQWLGFRNWYGENSTQRIAGDKTPLYIQSWPESSWLKYFVRYLIYTNKYFVYPKTSYSTNFSDSGTHVKSSNSYFQVPITINSTNYFQFIELRNSINVYDSYFELEPQIVRGLNNNLKDIEFVMDLYGQKKLEYFPELYAISSKELKDGATAVRRFGSAMKPMPLNVILDMNGTEITLSERSSFREMPSTKVAGLSEWNYYYGKVQLKLLCNILIQEFKKRVGL